MAAHRRLFPQRAVSRFGNVSRPPGSPDLTLPDFFLIWVYCKSKVYIRRTVDLNALKQDIRDEIIKISQQNISLRYAQLSNSGASEHVRVWRPPKTHCTQRVKEFATN